MNEGGTFSALGHRFNISYVAGDGNDVSLTYVERLPYLTLSSTPGNGNVAENLTGLVVGQLLVDGQDPAALYQLSVADARFEIVSGKLKLKQDNSVKLADGATVVVDVTAKEVAAPGREGTESFTLTVTANPRPWRNPVNATDSNGDGTVVPLDALRIINLLNNPTILDANNTLPATRAANSALPFYDVNGDGFCTPNDVLRVVNFLNSNPQGEGEATPEVLEPDGLDWLAFELDAGAQTNGLCPETDPCLCESLAEQRPGPSGSLSRTGVDRVLETWSEPDLPLDDRDDPDLLTDDLLADDLLAEDLLAEMCDAWRWDLGS